MMNDKQRLRNLISELEDEARKARNDAPECSDAAHAFALIARLAQIVRQDIVS